MTEGFKVQTGRQTIKIRPTHQRLSAQAGQTIFWGFLHRLKVREKLAALLPHRRTSPNALAPVEIALSFISGVLAGATKLARVSWLRSDSLLAEVMEIKRLPSQSTLSRFFAAFTKPQEGGACWRGLWRWGLEQISSRPGGFALDLDSTTLCHDGRRQEGVEMGYTPQGIRPCLHPLLAVLAEAKLCVQFWLRPGRANSGNNVVGFTEELLANLPSHVRLRLIRADSGFQNERWFELLESRGLRYIVVADFSQRLQRFVRAQTRWIPTGLAGLEVADVVYESHTGLGPRRRRLILIRRQVQANPEGLGRLLLECPGYHFQALLTNLPASVAVLWAQPVLESFHARYAARSRRYRYQILNRPVRAALDARYVTWERLPLDAGRMHLAAQALLGEHDFSAFRALSCQAAHPRRTVLAVNVRREGEQVLIEIEANAFLHHMVRNIVGSLLPIGRAEQPVEWMAELLAGCDRQVAGPTAPATGLTFVGPRYERYWGLPADVCLAGAGE